MANENLQNALEQAGLTIEAFAEVIRVDPKSVQRWVTGNTTPYPRHRKAISRALNLHERELWPEQTPADTVAAISDQLSEDPGGVCDVLRTWGYADDETAPDLVAFITESDGPIDLLDSPGGIELTAELTTTLAAQAAAGRPVRVLSGTVTEDLRALVGQPTAEVRVDQLWVEFWFLRVGERMLFVINFQDDVAVFPPPVLELTGTVTGGLFDRAQDKFEQLWDETAEHPEALLSTQAQLDEILTRLSTRERNPPDGQPPPDAVSRTAAVPSAHGQAPAALSAKKPGPPQRRWPGRPD